MKSARSTMPRHPMVGWYDPAQLLRTAGRVFVSTLFGRFSDHRLLEAISVGLQTPEDFSDRDEVVVDYAADVGDGWNSTYAIAYWISRPGISLQDGTHVRHQLRRGDLMVFGGDQVYPTPSRRLYKEKLVQPYEAAMRNSHPPHPMVFAVPGNHDWYDSLASFTRLFCRMPNGRVKWFAGWQAAQTRSYFAVKLTGGWWLVGLDVQLASSVDEPQVSYFRDIAGRMAHGDRVILCTAEPDWIYAKWWGAMTPECNDANTRFVEDKLFGGKVRVFLAGDLHHYRRHESHDGRQKIVAGGGGAFLHPTHGPDSQTLAGGFECRAEFPSKERSRRLAWTNLWFFVLNPTFGLATGIGYLLTAWTLMSGVTAEQLEAGHGVSVLFNRVLASPAALFVVAAVFMSFWLFTDTHSKPYRAFAGTLHAATHLALALGLGWMAAAVTAGVFPYGSPLQRLAAGLLVFVLGGFGGAVILGLYLLISLNVFGRHTTEAFSSLRIADWKNFLRIVVRRDGTLTIYPIGIERVPRTWKPSHVGEHGDYDPELVPDDPRATYPRLIEPPITL